MRLHHLLLLGAIVLGACKDTTAPARTPYALALDGNSYAQVGSAGTLDLGDNAWTAEAWVKPATGGERRQFIVGQWGDPGRASWALELEEGYLIGETHNGVFSLRMTDSVPLVPNNWHHVAFAFQHGSGTVYVDGKAIVSSSSFPLPMSGVQPLLFGAQSASSNDAIYKLKGELADVRLWSVTRSGAQIAGGRFQRLRGNEPGLLAYWPLDEGTGDPKDRVRGLVASLGGPSHAAGQQPTWVQDSLLVK